MCPEFLFLTTNRSQRFGRNYRSFSTRTTRGMNSGTNTTPTNPAIRTTYYFMPWAPGGFAPDFMTPCGIRRSRRRRPSFLPVRSGSGTTSFFANPPGMAGWWHGIRIIRIGPAHSPCRISPAGSGWTTPRSITDASATFRGATNGNCFRSRGWRTTWKLFFRS